MTAMSAMSAVSDRVLRPSEFCRHLLDALAASEGRRRRRKRDTTPDALGLDLKRDLLLRAIAADPGPEGFEAWLLEQVLAAPASGPVRAMCAEILDEYHVARLDPQFGRWLAAGAPSDDAEAGGDVGGEDERGRGARRRPGWREDQYEREGRWGPGGAHRRGDG